MRKSSAVALARPAVLKRLKNGEFEPGNFNSIFSLSVVIGVCGSLMLCRQAIVSSRRSGLSRFISTMPKPLVVAGPSGSGKSTLLKKLMAEYKSEFGFSVSHTTRQPRTGEQNGINYHFTTKEEMTAAVARGEFIESAEFSGNMYGTSIKAVTDVTEKGQICLLDIDMQGVRSVKKTDLKPSYVLIRAPSMEELEKRLRGRGTESDGSLAARLGAAKEELEYASQPGVFDYVVVNDKLERAYAEFRNIIQEIYPHLKSQ